MTTVDGTPLSPESKRDLDKLIALAGDATSKGGAPSSADADRIAKAVLVAFKRSHVVRRGRWEPLNVFQLAGGAIVTRGGM